MDRLTKTISLVTTGATMLTGLYWGVTSTHDTLQEFREVRSSVRQLQGDAVLTNMRIDIDQLKAQLKLLNDPTSEAYQDTKARLDAAKQEMRDVSRIYQERYSDVGYYAKYYAKQGREQ